MPRRLNPIKSPLCIPTALLRHSKSSAQTRFGSRRLSTQWAPRVSRTSSLGVCFGCRVTNSSLRCTSTSSTTATNPNTTRTAPVITTLTSTTGVQKRAVRLYSSSAAHLLELRLSPFRAFGTATSMTRDIVDLTSSPPDSSTERDIPEEEEEDEDLKLAIALSLQQHEAEHNEGRENSALSTFDVPYVAFTTPACDASNTNGIRGLDRKAMEAERLARLKRKRDASDEGSQANTSRISPPPLRRAATSRSQGKQDSTGKVNGTSSHSKSNATASNTYPQGKVFKTHAPGYPTDDTISFSSLISPLKNLKSALLSSFIWDFDWLLPNFSTYLNSINLLLVMHAKQHFHKQQLEADFERIKTVRLCFPPMDGAVHCMHSKLMLLFYKAEETNDEKWRERCRIVVPTGNLVPFDWGVGSVMENMLWVLDLPLLTPTDGAQRQQSTEFKQSLLGFLKAQNVPDAVLTRLNRFDFVETQDVRFVHTIGGAHSGETWRDTGLCGLGKAVSSLGLATGDAIDVDFVTSSVGSLNDEFMRSIYLACQGDDGLADYTLRNTKTLPAKRIGASTDKQVVHKNSGSGWKDHFRLYFPSQKTVASSNGGPQGAGTICFSEKWWDGAKFPRGNMHDCLSVRDGMLMHNKVIFVRLPQTIPGRPAEAKEYVGWVYLGSANLSESAWGRLVQDKTSKRPKLSCRNWECGVLLSAKKDGAHAGFDVFTSVLPMPLKLPAVSLETSKQTPWFFGGE